MVGYKLGNRVFEARLLQALLADQADHGGPLALQDQPSTWRYTPRARLAWRMGYSRCTKAVSRRIRHGFVWLASVGYLRHQDVNLPGNQHGATRFLLAYWVFRLAAGISAAVQGVVSKAVPEVSRTPMDLGWTPGMAPPGLRASPLYRLAAGVGGACQ